MNRTSGRQLWPLMSQCRARRLPHLAATSGCCWRMAANRFAGDWLIDFSGPVLKLANLTPEDCYVLLHAVRRVHAGGDAEKYLLPDEAIEAYLHSCQQRMGSACFQTPRDTVKDFIGLLDVLQQNPGADWKTLLAQITTKDVQTADLAEIGAAPDEDDDLASFKV